jgi:hypothetical protein
MVHQPPDSVRRCDASVTSVTAKAPEKLSHMALFYGLFRHKNPVAMRQTSPNTMF